MRPGSTRHSIGDAIVRRLRALAPFRKHWQRPGGRLTRRSRDKGLERMVRMGTVWDRTAEFLGDNVSDILPVALFAFFVPASIGGNFDALRAGGGPTLPMLLALVQLAFAVLSFWGTLTITAMGLDLVSDRSAGRVALSRLPAAVLVMVLLLAAILMLAAPIPAVLAATGHDL